MYRIWGNLQLRSKLVGSHHKSRLLRFVAGATVTASIVGWGFTHAYAQNLYDDNQGVWIYKNPPPIYTQATAPYAKVQVADQTFDLSNVSNSANVDIVKRLYNVNPTNNSVKARQVPNKTAKYPSIYKSTLTKSNGLSYSGPSKSMYIADNLKSNWQFSYVQDAISVYKLPPTHKSNKPQILGVQYALRTTNNNLPSEEIGVEIKSGSRYYKNNDNLANNKKSPIINNNSKYLYDIVQTKPNTVIVDDNKPKNLSDQTPSSNFEHDWGVSIEQHYNQKKTAQNSNSLNTNKYNYPTKQKYNQTNIDIYNKVNNINKKVNNENIENNFSDDINNDNKYSIFKNQEIQKFHLKFENFDTNDKLCSVDFFEQLKQNKRSFSKDDQIITDQRETSQQSHNTINPPGTNIVIDKQPVEKNKPAENAGQLPPGAKPNTDTTATSGTPGAEQASKEGNKDSFGNVVDSEGFPIPPVEEGYFRFKAANKVDYDRKQEIITLEGDVTIYSGDIMIAADKIVVDQRANTIQAWGYVCVQRFDDIFFADEAYLNYATGNFRAVGISGNSGGPQINGTLYFKGEELFGTLDKYTITRGEITTCEPYCAPEYSLYARKLIIEPKRKITLIHGFAKIYKAKTLYIPYMVLPLEEQYIRRNRVRSDIQQAYGYNENEGYFAKFAYTYSQKYIKEVTSGLIGAALLDMTSRRGFRYGLRQDYFISPLGVGTIRGEYQSGPAIEKKYRDRAEAKNFQINFNQELFLDSHNQGSLSYRKIDDQPDPKRPRSKSENFSFQFSNTYEKFNLSTNLTKNVTESGGVGAIKTSKNDNLNSGMTLKYQINPLLDFSASQSYSSNKTSSYNTADLEGNTNLSLRWSPRPASIDISYTRDQDFDGDRYIGDSTMSLNRVNPRVNITWKPSAIFGKYKSDVPITRLDTSFVEQITGNRNDPKQIQIWELNTALSKMYKLTPEASVNFDFGFQQNFYSDMNARFSTSPRASFNFDDRHLFSCNFNWYKTRSFGRISPRASASSYNYHSDAISYGFSFSDYETVKFTFNTGYNCITRRQDPFSMALYLDLNPWVGMNIRGSYDYELQRFGLIDWVTQYYDPHGKFTAELRQTLRPYRDRKAKQSWFDRADLKIAGKLHHDLDFNFYTDYQHGRSNAPIKELSFRKRNCCSQLDFGWRATSDSTGEVFVFFTLHAFPTRTAGTRIIENDVYFFSPLGELFNPNIYTQGTGITF